MRIIDDFLKGLPVNPILREKILEMDTTINRLTEENIALKKENADLLTKNSELSHVLADKTMLANDFTNTRGLKIRKLPTGGYEETIAYCVQCKTPLSSSHRTKNLECSQCWYKSSIQARHLSVVISELRGNYDNHK